MSRLNAMRLTVSSTHFLKKMDEFAETFDTILEKGKQQGCEMLKKNLNARQHPQGDTTVPVLKIDVILNYPPVIKQTPF